MRTSRQEGAQPHPDVTNAIAEFIFENVQAGEIDEIAGCLLAVGRAFPKATVPQFIQGFDIAVNRDGWCQ